MTGASAALERLCAREFEVSAHYLIAMDGTLYQLVAEANRAWHAGVGIWQGQRDINSRSIGIELDNCGTVPFPESQMVALEKLLHEIMNRWKILPVNVIAHSDFALGRKVDPGPKFDWRRLAHQGLSIWSNCVTKVRPHRQQFAAATASIGYPNLGDCDDQTEFQLLLDAFRLRFAPWRRGELDSADMAVAEDLARRFGKLDPEASDV